MDLRRLFVRAHALGGVSMTELCEHFGIGRKTGYKWFERVERTGRWRLDQEMPLDGIRSSE
jgi:transposase